MRSGGRLEFWKQTHPAAVRVHRQEERRDKAEAAIDEREPEFLREIHQICKNTFRKKVLWPRGGDGSPDPVAIPGPSPAHDSAFLRPMGNEKTGGTG